MTKLTVILAIGVLTVSPLIPQVKQPSVFSPYVDEEGTIRLPKEYRGRWTHLGTYAVINESKDGHGLHEVYSRSSDIEAYNRTGEWPDGAVIVKEVRHTTGARMTTGDSHWATDINVWFVMVKDKEERFPDNPIWGEGWGWALFKGNEPDTQAATSYKKDCLGCHIPAKGDDWVYIDGYPLLRDDPFASGSQLQTKVAEAALQTPAQADVPEGAARRGERLFVETCKVCHNANSKERKFGPGLAGISSGTLPSGKTASIENIEKQIKEGGNGMPSFGDALTAEELADLAAYVKTR